VPTHSSLVPAHDREPAGWWLTAYPSAAEAGGSFLYQLRRRPPAVRGGPAADPERSRVEAARRARARVRRYCAANRLNRLGTLTYAGAGCHDVHEFRGDIAAFFRNLRDARGGQPFPYLWVPEWHPGGHGLHGHFAVGQYVPRGLIAEAWGLRFVSIKLLSDLPVGSGRLDEARRAAGYLSKYVGKSFGEDRPAGLHRFDVAQGFQPERVRVYGRTCREALAGAGGLMGSPVPSRVWDSRSVEAWQGPPCLWASWPG